MECNRSIAGVVLLAIVTVSSLINACGSDEKKINAFIEQLSDNDVEVRRAAVVGLLRNHSLESAKNAVPALMEALNDSDVKVSANAAIVLGVIGDPAAVPALQKALSDEREMGGHKIVRVQAAQALERIDTPEAREALSQWKRNESN